MNRLVAACLVLSACGDDKVPAGAAVDAGPDAAVFPVGCDYAEQSDVSNDYTFSNFTSEVTNLTLAQSATICGSVQNNFNPTLGTVDVDGYELAVTEAAQVLITLIGPASTLAGLEVQILESDKTVIDRGVALGSHVAFQTRLIPGTYQIGVVATGTADFTAAFDYKLQIVVDAPDTRCPASTATAAYAEQNDGPQSDRNDVLEVSYALDTRTLTTAANDNPEDTALATTAGANLRITGTSDNVDPADDFKDRDTYLITTGAHDQLTVRVDWTGDADFDFLLVPENATTEIASGSAVSKTGEFATFPVLPNTRYWLWVGSFDTSAGLPLDYSVTLCPTAATP